LDARDGALGVAERGGDLFDARAEHLCGVHRQIDIVGRVVELRGQLFVLARQRLVTVGESFGQLGPEQVVDARVRCNFHE
jgi:hypothetical protein